MSVICLFNKYFAKKMLNLLLAEFAYVSKFEVRIASIVRIFMRTATELLQMSVMAVTTNTLLFSGTRRWIRKIIPTAIHSFFRVLKKKRAMYGSPWKTCWRNWK